MNNMFKLQLKLTSSPIGTNLWLPSVSTSTAACFIGQTRNKFFFLGWYWTFNTGDGNLYISSLSPLNMFQVQTLLSVDALNNLCPFLDQLKIIIGYLG